MVRAAHQQITVEWWAGREAFELFVSEAVLAEVRRGDADAATCRMEAAAALPVLSTSPAAEQLAAALLKARTHQLLVVITPTGSSIDRTPLSIDQLSSRAAPAACASRQAQLSPVVRVAR